MKKALLSGLVAAPALLAQSSNSPLGITLVQNKGGASLGVPGLTLINPRIGQRIEVTTIKDSLKLFDKRVVDQTVRCQGFFAVELKWRSVKTTDFASGFLDDQRPGCRIPRIEIEFPESVEATARYTAQVERSRPRTTHTMTA